MHTPAYYESNPTRSYASWSYKGFKIHHATSAPREPGCVAWRLPGGDVVYTKREARAYINRAIFDSLAVNAAGGAATEKGAEIIRNSSSRRLLLTMYETT